MTPEQLKSMIRKPETVTPLYDLVEISKQIQELLEDKVDSKQRDEYGDEPLILETGLCSLVDEYHEEEYLVILGTFV